MKTMCLKLPFTYLLIFFFSQSAFAERCSDTISKYNDVQRDAFHRNGNLEKIFSDLKCVNDLSNSRQLNEMLVTVSEADRKKFSETGNQEISIGLRYHSPGSKNEIYFIDKPAYTVDPYTRMVYDRNGNRVIRSDSIRTAITTESATHSPAPTSTEGEAGENGSAK